MQIIDTFVSVNCNLKEIEPWSKGLGVHRGNFVRDLLAGAEILLFAEKIPESNATPDVHTIMVVSVFARTEDLKPMSMVYDTAQSFLGCLVHS